MKLLYIVVSCTAFSGSVLGINKIPDDFVLGCGTSAYQIEGGWNESGKGISIWDTAAHTTKLISGGETGDIACDSFHKYKEDVKMLKDIDAQVYRFSIAWTRILPTGDPKNVNMKGINYYNKLIDLLLKNNITPMVTIYHWDLPQPLQDKGGWTSSTVIEYFVRYAAICFKYFGDRVKLWTTFNEPMQVCHRGYGSAEMAPIIKSPGVGEYLCTHNLLKAHGKAYRMYEKDFKKAQGGSISIVVDFTWFVPMKNSSASDRLAAETARNLYVGWFLNPLVRGNYPEVMIKGIAEKSKKEGRKQSRLPVFTKDEQQYLKGAYDFFGINIYTTEQATFKRNQTGLGLYQDLDLNTSFSSDWVTTASPYFVITPWGARDCLNWIKNEYNDPEIYVTENGIANSGTTLADDFRVTYMKKYIAEILNAKVLDKVNVKGWIGWSLMDNLEWTSGYSLKFGIYSVDFTSPDRTRTPKVSAKYFKKIRTTKCLVDHCN